MVSIEKEKAEFDVDSILMKLLAAKSYITLFNLIADRAKAAKL